MNKTLKWVLIGLAIVVGLCVLTLPILTLVHTSGRGMMMNGWGWREGWRTMHQHGRFILLPFLCLLGLGSLAVVGLVISGVLALARGTSVQTPPAVPPAVVTEGRICKVCAKPLADEGAFCPHCGAEQTGVTAKARRARPLITGTQNSRSKPSVDGS